MVGMEVGQDQQRNLADPEQGQAVVGLRRIRTGVDDDGFARTHGERQGVALPDIAGCEDPVLRRPDGRAAADEEQHGGDGYQSPEHDDGDCAQAAATTGAVRTAPKAIPSTASGTWPAGVIPTAAHRIGLGARRYPGSYLGHESSSLRFAVAAVIRNTSA